MRWLALIGVTLLCACQAAPAADVTTSKAAVMVTACSGCHQPDQTAMPSLDGMSTEEMRASLLRYKTEPGTTVMHRLARGYSDADILLISEYLGGRDD